MREARERSYIYFAVLSRMRVAAAAGESPHHSACGRGRVARLASLRRLNVSQASITSISVVKLATLALFR